MDQSFVVNKDYQKCTAPDRNQKCDKNRWFKVIFEQLLSVWPAVRCFVVMVC